MMNIGIGDLVTTRSTTTTGSWLTTLSGTPGRFHYQSTSRPTSGWPASWWIRRGSGRLRPPSVTLREGIEESYAFFLESDARDSYMRTGSRPAPGRQRDRRDAGRDPVGETFVTMENHTRAREFERRFAEFMGSRSADCLIQDHRPMLQMVGSLFFVKDDPLSVRQFTR